MPDNDEPDPSPDTTATVSWWPAAITVAAMASWPFLDVVASNPTAPLDMSVIRTWWLLTLVPALAVLALVVWRRPRRAPLTGVVLGVALWLLWNLHTTTALRDAVGLGIDDTAWWAIIAVVVLAVAALLGRKVPIQRFVAVVSVALVVSSTVTWMANGVEAAPPNPATGEGDFVHDNDVWFIALDALAGSDVLRARGYDDRAFLDALRDDGFRIQSPAYANYPLTKLSLSATFQMEYTFTGVDEPLQGPYFTHMSGVNDTVEMFRTNGYGYVHAYPGFYNGSRCSGAEDHCFGGEDNVNDTDTALATRTPLHGLLLGRTDVEVIARANDPAEQVARILTVDRPGPTFHFVHSLNPHPPLLRDAECRLRDVPLRLSGWGDGPEYVDAVRCLHEQLELAADLILADDPDAIVVIQGDHGPRLDLGDPPDRFAYLSTDEHFSILSAIRLPEVCADLEVPDDLTPVNTFRLVRACLEDRPPDLLENRRFPIQRQRNN